MAKKRSCSRRRRAGVASPRYDSTPWPGLVGAPFVLLFNMLVTTEEDNVRTDGLIPLDAVEIIQALVRRHYDFPDLALDAGQGVVISLIGQFFHVDDYGELHVGQRQRDYVLALLQGRGEEGGETSFDLGGHQLRRSKVTDPQTMIEGKEPAAWYKQRLLAFYFVGQRDQIERLAREQPGEELLRGVLDVLADALDLGQRLRVHIHPAFVPATGMPAVSRQNALEWARIVKKKLATGDVGAISVVGPPGPSYTVKG